jgi:hypothetical protein
MDLQLEDPEPVRMCPKAKAGPQARGTTVAEFREMQARKLQEKRLRKKALDEEEVARLMTEWKYRPHAKVPDMTRRERRKALCIADGSVEEAEEEAGADSACLSDAAAEV